MDLQELEKMINTYLNEVESYGEEGEYDEDDPLAVDVASYVTEEGLPLRDLGKSLPKETKAQIKALGVNLHGFLEMHPEWFIVGEGDDAVVTLKPFDSPALASSSLPFARSNLYGLSEMAPRKPFGRKL